MKIIVYTFFTVLLCWVFLVAGVSNLLLVPFMSTLFVGLGGTK